MSKARPIRSLISDVNAATGALALAIVFVLTVVASQAAQAQTFTLIHTFTGAGDGGNPEAGVVFDKVGNIYGTTYNYGAGYGAVYQLKNKNNNWTVNPLYSFKAGKDGANPRARVIFGPDGSLYGTTALGGPSNLGTVFRLRPPASAPKSAVFTWDETVLYSFKGGPADGGYPGYGDLTFDGAGNIYGTTPYGGHSNCNTGCGIVYELTPPGSWNTETVLYYFSGDDGAYPFNNLIFDDAGNLYSTTVNGGLGNWGTAFELMYPGPTEIVINTWVNEPGSYPYAGLIFDKSGNLYGATYNGGTGHGGTVFELTPVGNNNWTYTLIYSFTGGANCGPFETLVMDGAGNLYGTTYCDGAHGYGNVFELSPSNGGWTYTDLYDFNGGNDGKYPYGEVAFDANGNLYGTTYGGGSNTVGVVWELSNLP